MSKLKLEKIKPLLKRALEEDIKSGDITTKLIITKNFKIKANIIAKESGIIAGLDIAKAIFKLRDKNIKFVPNIRDGDLIKVADTKNKKIIASIEGNVYGILEAERTALNFLSHLSGIASLTQEFVKRVRNYKARITDTRKTTPNLRYLEKYAVRVGGGYNHRMGLYDKVLIKDNHIKTAKLTAAECVLSARQKTSKPIEVEIKNVSCLEDALKVQPDIIMFDNMNLNEIKKAMVVKKKFFYKNKDKKIPQIEVSGNVNLLNVRKIAAYNVDFISIGALTHSNPALDMALRVV